ncbi:hypothetical protein QJS10_CPB13g01534 [Acorus calamus]|uniref:Uncharacterized protein n=1 Tax=Acorus calamus TaxID=4465 RepID=A0AAV9DG32_ACOCL|nr:hypothetical protein QJS10_CPB13g01534 [Acorus calamus]
MAILRVLLLAFLALAHVQASTCLVVEGSCAKEKRLTMATTNQGGSFKAELPPTTTATASSSPDCLAVLLGGPERLCGPKKGLVSKVVKAPLPDTYTVSAPLSIFSACPSGAEKAAQPVFGNSKTFDLPLPPEWGLPPTSFFIPFFPIIGIP